MEFHETRGGHEFYFGTMPAIKQNLAALTVAVESLTEAVNNINATLNQQQRSEGGCETEDTLTTLTTLTKINPGDIVYLEIYDTCDGTATVVTNKPEEREITVKWLDRPAACFKFKYDDIAFIEIKEAFSLPEFKGRIVDVFEDFCETNDISIENSDRDEEEDDGAAIIYGEDYDTIADEVEFLFERFKAPFESQEVITTVTNCCGNFEEILQERGSKILEDDSELYDKCMEVFKAYNLIAA